MGNAFDEARHRHAEAARVIEEQDRRPDPYQGLRDLIVELTDGFLREAARSGVRPPHPAFNCLPLTETYEPADRWGQKPRYTLKVADNVATISVWKLAPVYDGHKYVYDGNVNVYAMLCLDATGHYWAGDELTAAGCIPGIAGTAAAPTPGDLASQPPAQIARAVSFTRRSVPNPARSTSFGHASRSPLKSARKPGRARLPCTGR